MDWIEIKVMQLAKWFIVRGWGCRCLPENFVEECGECQAGRVVRWLDEYIQLLKS